ncbi:amidase [Mesorhizobium sp. M2C.T.Ca.TU.002.02.1.1]|uniref:amidase n=1 Tax=Mesorhizobium sp. M2C.T.Ca.TU.002.02.1.1 TaxID=2496788 RepID=UPI000FCB2C57|nr:amidase [Mesorhizobium sp. M2C.T.Ca.TU.002.02.1.1]RUU56665.1 amidase [Mesorhizobium sp. M2C.T.Ca.TU.002.02.1.1]RUU71338.1 amidase [Mesorhizobium sp. M2C.T.Ca.TU.009.01.2.1]
MRTTEYEKHDGLALAKLLHAGEISPVELMDCAISLAEDRGQAANALCNQDYDLGRRLAAEAELKGTFGAMPFLLKDSGLASTQLASDVGSRLFAGLKAKVDSTLNTRFVADGFLSFARTTVPEFCMAPTTEAVQNGGPTLNPWDRTRSPGGSSGGAAAAVALGIVPVAHGSDGGGSIRIPASCCGVFGLKPSRGLVPHGPARGEGWGGLAVDGVLSRTVRDTAAALDGIAGMELGQPYAAPTRPDSYLEYIDGEFDRPLRVAKWTQAWNDIDIAPECLDAVAAAERHLAALGHEVIEAPLPQLKYDAFVDAIIDVMAASVAMTVNGYVRLVGPKDLPTLLEPAILDAYRLGEEMHAETYALAINRFHSIARLMETYLADYDVILTPTLTQPPVKLGEISMNDDFRSFRKKAGRYTTFLAVINASGQPAASVPLHWTEGNLPIGIQLVGRFGTEATLLRLSAQLESIAPWRDRRPMPAVASPHRN